MDVRRAMAGGCCHHAHGNRYSPARRASRPKRNKGIVANAPRRSKECWERWVLAERLQPAWRVPIRIVHALQVRQAALATHVRSRRTASSLGEQRVNSCSQGRTDHPGRWYGRRRVRQRVYIRRTTSATTVHISRFGRGQWSLRASGGTVCVYYDNGATSAGGLGPDRNRRREQRALFWTRQGKIEARQRATVVVVAGDRLSRLASHRSEQLRLWPG